MSVEKDEEEREGKQELQRAVEGHSDRLVDSAKTSDAVANFTTSQRAAWKVNDSTRNQFLDLCYDKTPWPKVTHGAI